MNDDVRVTSRVTIPGSEIELRFSPSGGPGGQHANRASTRVELVWNVAESAALGPRQRDRVLQRLRHRIDSSGNLRLASDARRSQAMNRKAVLERFQMLMCDALKPRKQRYATTPTNASKEKRLQDKKRRSEIKRSRRVEL